MPGFDGFLGEAGGMARQLFLWGMLEELVRELIVPFLRALEQDVNATTPNAVLSPAELVEAVLKHWMDQEAAAAEAQRSGVDARRFQTMVDSAGEPIGLESALQYWRRGFIPFTAPETGALSVETAVRQSRVRDQWLKAIHQGHLTPPSAANAVEAVLRNQITETAGLALSWYAGLGVHDLSLPTDPAVADTKRAFDILVHTAGIPPAPSELLTMIRRGIITWGTTTAAHKTPNPEALTFGQGFYEGDHKDKWVATYKGLEEELLSAYYILTFMKDGSLPVTEALRQLKMYGYSQGVISALVASAHKSAVSTYTKLTESITVKLYEEKAVTRTQAKQMLVDLGYVTVSATYVLTAIDLDLSYRETTAAINKVRALFLARKITATVAKRAISAYGVTGTSATAVLAIWSQELTLTVKLLTESQIADAWEYGIMTTGQALSELRAIGYTPYDAWVVLSLKNKAPLPTAPERTSSGIGTLAP